MMRNLVLLSIEQSIAVVTLNRPEVRNAIDDEMRTQLIALLEGLANDGAISAVVITGAGKGFCAGGDIAGMQERLAVPAGEVAFNGWRRQKRTHQSVAALHGMPKPTIAAVNGAAVGLGCDMAMACDFVVASETATFGMSFVRRGLIPDGGGMYFLPRRIGLARAKELIFSGRTVNANEALQLGMVDRLAAPETLVSAAVAWAAELSQGPLQHWRWPSRFSIARSRLPRSSSLRWGAKRKRFATRR